MEALMALLAMLRQATQRLRALQIAWWLIGAALVAAFSLQLFGSGRAAITSVGIALLGLILAMLVSVLSRTAERGATWLRYPVQTLVWATVLFLLAFLGLTVSAAIECKPRPWARFLQLDCDIPQPETIGAHFRRTVDSTDAGCRADGSRYYNEVIRDELTFSSPIARYQIQANRDDTSQQSVAVEYLVNGEKREPVIAFEDSFGGPQRATRWVPVNGTKLTVTYKWRQTPQPNDVKFGLGFVSSLPILSISSDSTLPPGKEVSGLLDESTERRLESAKCDFSPGKTPRLSCTTKPVTELPNEQFIVYWKWNVFDGC